MSLSQPALHTIVVMHDHCASSAGMLPSGNVQSRAEQVSNLGPAW